MSINPYNGWSPLFIHTYGVSKRGIALRAVVAQTIVENGVVRLSNDEKNAKWSFNFNKFYETVCVFMKLCVYCVKIIAPSDVEPVLSIANHRYLLLNRIIGYFELNRTE